jgi:hypothetical protein
MDRIPLIGKIGGHQFPIPEVTRYKEQAATALKGFLNILKPLNRDGQMVKEPPRRTESQKLREAVAEVAKHPASEALDLFAAPFALIEASEMLDGSDTLPPRKHIAEESKGSSKCVAYP